MKMMKLIQNKQGLTLIELLVAATIISILMAIGIPAWRLHNQRSKHTEAKINLSIVHSSQEAYRQYCGQYFPDLRAIQPPIEGEIHYNIGGKYSPSDFSISKACFNPDIDCSDPDDCITFFNNKDGFHDNDICCSSIEDFKNESDCSSTRCFFKHTKSVVNMDEYIQTLTSTELEKIYNSGTGIKEIKPNEYLIFAMGDFRWRQVRRQYDVWVVNHKGVPMHIQKSTVFSLNL